MVASFVIVEPGLASVPATFERRLRAVAEALFSTSAGPPDPARVDWVVRDFADFTARVASRPRVVFLVCTWVLTWIAPLFVGRLGPLESLDVPLRVRALERVERSLLGPAALGPKIMLCTIWFEHPALREVSCSR